MSKKTLPPLNRASALFGILAGLGGIAAIIWDWWLYAGGRVTISQWCLDVARSHSWFAFWVCLLLTLPVTILDGHLFLPRDGPKVILPSVAGIVTAAGLGPLLGWLVFSQSGK